MSTISRAAYDGFSEQKVVTWKIIFIDGDNSCLFDFLLGIVQGSILGPILNIIIVPPMFDLKLLFSFADNKYVMYQKIHALNIVL